MFDGPVETRTFFISGGIVLLAILISCLAGFLLNVIKNRFNRKSPVCLGALFFKSLRWPVALAVFVLGIYSAILYLPFDANANFEIQRGLQAAYILLAALIFIAVSNSIFNWYKINVAEKTNSPLDDWIIAILRILTPIQAAGVAVIAVLEMYNISFPELKEWLLVHGTRIAVVWVVAVFLLFLLGRAIPPAIRRFVTQGMAGSTDDEIHKRVQTLSTVIVTTIEIFILLICAFIVISEVGWGDKVTPILASASVIGLAVGFGAQSLVKDVISGLFILMENQYRVGDVVKIAGVGGLVEEINLRRTVLRDADGIVHFIPNGNITVASNQTRGWSKVNTTVSVDYGTDLNKAIDVINRACKEMAAEPEWASQLMQTPTALWVDNLGDSGIDIRVAGQTKPGQQWAVAGEIRKRIKEALDKAGISIPYPHTTLVFKNSVDGGGIPVDKAQSNNTVERK